MKTYRKKITAKEAREGNAYIAEYKGWRVDREAGMYYRDDVGEWYSLDRLKWHRYWYTLGTIFDSFNVRDERYVERWKYWKAIGDIRSAWEWVVVQVRTEI